MPFLAREAYRKLQHTLNEKAPKHKKPYSAEKAEGIVSKAGFAYIGNGSRSVLIADKELPGLAIGIDYRSERYKTIEAAICTYYAHQVLHTLFPENFPKIYTVYGGSSGSGSVREKKQILKPRIRKDKIQEFNQKKWHTFIPIYNLINSVGLPFFIDKNEDNFGYDSKRNILFLDLVHVYQQQVKTMSIEYIGIRLKEKGYQEAQIQAVTKILQRVYAICEQSEQY